MQYIIKHYFLVHCKTIKDQMLRLKLHKELPIFYGKRCSVYIATNGYKRIETIAGKVKYNAPIVECSGSHRYESKRLIKKKSVKMYNPLYFSKINSKKR